MSTTKHTPAPWFVDSDPEGAEDCQSVWYENGYGVSAEIAGRICEPANAALIAAAPELLEALQGAAGYLDHYIQEIGGCDHAVNICCCDEVRALEKYRALIAKAEGRS